MKSTTTMYEKHNWVNGEVITEDKLNHMEEGISTGGGIYSFDETYLFDGEVETTENEWNFSVSEFTTTKPLPESDLKVIFNGKEYLLPYTSLRGFYGEVDDEGPTFNNYPLYIELNNGTSYNLFTQESGVHSLQIPEGTQFVVSNELVSGIAMILKEETLGFATRKGDDIYLDKTFAEINEAFLNGKIVFVQTDTDRYYLLSTFIDSNMFVLRFIKYVEPELATDVIFKAVLYSTGDENGYPKYDSLKKSLSSR